MECSAGIERSIGNSFYNINYKENTGVELNGGELKI